MLLAFGKAKIVSGIDTVLRLIGFEKALENADAALTGEGKIDAQTCFGKGDCRDSLFIRRPRILTLGFAGMLKKWAWSPMTGNDRSFCHLPRAGEDGRRHEKCGDLFWNGPSIMQRA